MKIFYISHPFTGNENYNRREARIITGALTEHYEGQFIFFNPLDAMTATEHTTLSYNAVLRQTLEILDRCDGIIMTGEWQESFGCLSERYQAMTDFMEYYPNVGKFLDRYPVETGSSYQKIRHRMEAGATP